MGSDAHQMRHALRVSCPGCRGGTGRYTWAAARKVGYFEVWGKTCLNQAEKGSSVLGTIMTTANIYGVLIMYSCTLYYSKNFTCRSIFYIKCLECKHRSNTLHLMIHLSSLWQEGSSDLVMLDFYREKQSMDLHLHNVETKWGTAPSSGREGAQTFLGIALWIKSFLTLCKQEVECSPMGCQRSCYLDIFLFTQRLGIHFLCLVQRLTIKN